MASLFYRCFAISSELFCADMQLRVLHAAGGQQQMQIILSYPYANVDGIHASLPYSGTPAVVDIIAVVKLLAYSSTSCMLLLCWHAGSAP